MAAKQTNPATPSDGGPTPPSNQHGPFRDMDFDEFVDSASESARRSRNMMGLMMTAAFIAALGCFNALKQDYNWYRSRIVALENAYHWVVFPSDIAVTDKVRVNNVEVPNLFTFEAFREQFPDILLHNRVRNVDFIESFPDNIKLKIPEFHLENKVVTMDSLDKENLYSILIYLSQSHFVNRAEMENMLGFYNRGWLENGLFIRIPILGISFDVNWLAVISGTAFCILYFLLYHSLSRERKNLKLLFKLAKQRNYNRVDFYQLLSMQQVLTVPASIDEYIKARKKGKWVERKRKDVWKYYFKLAITVIPIVIPIIILSVIFAYDIYTTDIGLSLNPNLMMIHTTVSWVVILLALILSLVCVWEWYCMNRLWRKEADRIRKKLTRDLPVRP